MSSGLIFLYRWLFYCKCLNSFLIKSSLSRSTQTTGDDNFLQLAFTNRAYACQKMKQKCKPQPDGSFAKLFVSHYLITSDNLTIRLSSPMVDQGPIKSWPNTSTVVTTKATCPAPEQGGQCLDCRRCWNPKIKNISYGQH